MTVEQLIEKLQGYRAERTKIQNTLTSLEAVRAEKDKQLSALIGTTSLAECEKIQKKLTKSIAEKEAQFNELVDSLEEILTEVGNVV